jgi:hypothetical protein
LEYIKDAADESRQTTTMIKANFGLDHRCGQAFRRGTGTDNWALIIVPARLSAEILMRKIDPQMNTDFFSSSVNICVICG